MRDQGIQAGSGTVPGSVISIRSSPSMVLQAFHALLPLPPSHSNITGTHTTTLTMGPGGGGAGANRSRRHILACPVRAGDRTDGAGACPRAPKRCVTPVPFRGRITRDTFEGPEVVRFPVPRLPLCLPLPSSLQPAPLIPVPSCHSSSFRSRTSHSPPSFLSRPVTPLRSVP